MANFQSFVGEMQRLCSVHNKRYSEEQASAWWEDLCDLRWRDVRGAMRDAAKFSERYPSLAQVLAKALANAGHEPKCEECHGSGRVYARRRARNDAERHERYGWTRDGTTRDELVARVRSARLGREEIERWVARIPEHGIEADTGKYPQPCPECASGPQMQALPSVVEPLGSDDDDRAPGPGGWSWAETL